MKKLLTLAILGGLLLGTFLSIERKEVLENKYDVSIGAINGYSIDPTLKDFKTAAKVNGKDKVVDMVINSGGGSVHIGLEIIEEMKYMKSLGYKFNCYVRNAYSMGFIILQYCDHRIGSSNSTYMHHLVQVGYGGRPKRTENNKKLFKALDFFDKLVLDEIAKRMGIDPLVFFGIYREDKWWDAKEALKSNIIDEIRSFSLVVKKVKYKFVPFWRRY